MSQAQETFIVLSINHETVPLETRERYSVDKKRVDDLYTSLQTSGIAQEALILSTCNRLELYLRLSDSVSSNVVITLLAEFYQADENEVLAHLKTQNGKSAIQHLIEVSSGLRSQITGESEIFGQVKTAYAASQSFGYAGKVINRICQKAFQAAKLIRNSTTVGQGQINIANVAVELSSKIFGSLKNATALAIGTGEIGEKTVKALKSRGIREIGVASRSPERAKEAASNWGAKPHALEKIEMYLPDYDIVIACAGADTAIVTRSLVDNSGVNKRDLPLFLIDLGMPRNIEPSCENIDNVFLYNLDDLAAIAKENLADRNRAVKECQAIANQKADAIWETLKRRGDV